MKMKTSRVYGATEKKILAQLERNLDAARKDGASWRVLAALIAGAAVPLSELVGEVDEDDVELVEVRVLGDAEPHYIENRRPQKMIGGNTVTAEPIYEGDPVPWSARLFEEEGS